MQKIRITEKISFTKLLLIICRNMHVYCSDIKRDKIIGQNAALKVLLESRKSIKETIFNDPTVRQNNYKPGIEKVDFLIFDTLRSLKINRASVTRLQIPVHLVYQFAWMRNMCVDDCKNHEVCMHFIKVFFIENRYTFSRILTDHIYRRHRRMLMDYAKYINLEKNMVRTFFKHNASQMYRIKPQKSVIKIHECKFNSEIQSTVYLMRSLYNETDGFTQFMSDANFYNKTKSKESKDLYRANVVIVYTLMNLLDLVGSCIIKESHYQTLLASHTELKSLILEDFSNSDSKCTFFTPENCRKLHDCYLSYSAYIAEYLEYQDHKNYFIFPPFCYEYDIRWHLYSISDGSDYYKPSLESCNDGRRLYFRQYERQLYIAKLKHAIFFEYGKRLIKRLDDLFLTALSDPESPFGSSCMLILFSVIVNYY